jgi:uncharacterized protein (DUF488 family)
MSSGAEIFTVGHSTHSLAAFLDLLGRHEIECVADVRIIPSSRRLPHFGLDALARSLPEAGFSYVHLKDLGGRRNPFAGSPNTGWRVPGFRGYADYMHTEPFDAALEELMRLAVVSRTAVMCAEALWWRCHRRLISDALVVRGWQVVHIGSDGSLSRHELTAFAEDTGGKLVYPAPQGALDLGEP